jgi:hypothetical protein
MKTVTSIIVTLNVEGIHRFENVEEYYENVDFLKYPHRHIFTIKAEKLVHHDNRDVEFILFKRLIHEFLLNWIPVKDNVLDFGNMSCEQIARLVLEEFDCISVEVWEDNENGARVQIIN